MHYDCSIIIKETAENLMSTFTKNVYNIISSSKTIVISWFLRSVGSNFFNFSVLFTSPNSFICYLSITRVARHYSHNQYRCFYFLTLKSRQYTLLIVTFTDLYKNNAIAVLIYGLYYSWLCFITDNI